MSVYWCARSVLPTAARPPLQNCLPNQLDQGILRQSLKLRICTAIDQRWLKLAEVPFDYERRRLSVIVQDMDARPAMQPLLVCQVGLQTMPCRVAPA